tara:strand:- start:113 stop:412 length:300 start_codon:yes stop_codon:yes gene_type:complete
MSENKIMTAFTASAGDMLEVETIRKTVKLINKENKRLEERLLYGSPDSNVRYPRYRVKLQGRGPRTIHAVADGLRPRAYDQSLPLRHAERVDVYVYQYA